MLAYFLPFSRFARMYMFVHFLLIMIPDFTLVSIGDRSFMILSRVLAPLEDVRAGVGVGDRKTYARARARFAPAQADIRVSYESARSGTCSSQGLTMLSRNDHPLSLREMHVSGYEEADLCKS